MVDEHIYEDVGIDPFVNKIIECLPIISDDINRSSLTLV
jgi:hypothetical protein